MTNVREDKRKLRMNTVRKWIVTSQEQGNKIDKEKLIATICIEFGTSRRTALEYINTLVNAGMVVL